MVEVTNLLEIARCPICYSVMSLEPQPGSKDCSSTKGILKCISCNETYPIIDGIPVLFVVDTSWEPMVREYISRLDVAEKVILEGGFEKETAEVSDAHHEKTGSMMNQLFDIAVEPLEVNRNTSVLDVGAGFCNAAKHFASLGAMVVALDTELLHLQFMGILEYEESLEKQFARVVGDVHRLPFKDCSFDITICRSTIHHLDNVRGALREMARVTRPGGRVLLVSEPIRSITDRETDYLEGILEYEEGFNERSYPIYKYILPLAQYCNSIEIKYIQPGFHQRTATIFERLHIEKDKHYRDGETVSLKESVKLLFVGAGINVTGFRKSIHIKKPKRPMPEHRLFDLSDLFQVTVGWELAKWISLAPITRPDKVLDEEQLVYLKQYISNQRNVLKPLYRRLLDPGKYPYSIDMSETRGTGPGKGWMIPEEATGGKYRYTQKKAYCYLRNDESKKNVVITCHAFPPLVRNASGVIKVNERHSAFSISEPSQEVIASKPDTTEDILEIEIENDFTFIPDEILHNGDKRELGVSVSSIYQR